MLRICRIREGRRRSGGNVGKGGKVEGKLGKGCMERELKGEKM